MEISVDQLIMFQASDDHWYRGIITEISKSKYYVFAPDYGFIEKIFLLGEGNKVQPVFCEEFLRMKYFASPCRTTQKVNPLKDLEVVNLNVVKVENNIMYSVDII